MIIEDLKKLQENHFQNKYFKYLGIDYGAKKIGLAISDDLGKIAFALKIISNQGREKVLQEIFEILNKYKIQKIVIGESVNNLGEKNPIAEKIQDLISHLQNKIKQEKINKKEIEIYLEKEWYSTMEARQYHDSHQADASAAAIILQRYLDKVNK